MGLLDSLNELKIKKVEVEIRDFSVATSAQCMLATMEHLMFQKNADKVDCSDKAIEFLKMTLEMRDIEKRMEELSNNKSDSVEIQAESEMVN